jgi:hypothetical protein
MEFGYPDGFGTTLVTVWPEEIKADDKKHSLGQKE